MNLTDVHARMVNEDQEMMKIAAEHDAAGRIMARGFMDELTKIAETFGGAPSGNWVGEPQTVKAKMPITDPELLQARGKLTSGRGAEKRNIGAGTGEAVVTPYHRSRLPKAKNRLARKTRQAPAGPAFGPSSGKSTPLTPAANKLLSSITRRRHLMFPEEGRRHGSRVFR